LPAGGGLWTADQYTFRLIRDGDISEVAEDPPPEGRGGDPQPQHKTKGKEGR
jgi:hypothetical protein